MPITINGNGTITGYTPPISDGSITSAKLAANAVTSDKLNSNAVTSDKLHSDAVSASHMPSGSVIQVKNTNKTDLFNVDVTANKTQIGVTALDTTITTLVANSKILVCCQVYGEGNTDDHDFGLSWSRGIGGSFTAFMLADAASNRHRTTATMALGFYNADNNSTASSTALVPMLDTPNQAAGTAITYRINFTIGSNATRYIRGNRTFGDADSAGYERGSSWMTVMEIAP